MIKAPYTSHFIASWEKGLLILGPRLDYTTNFGHAYHHVQEASFFRPR